jgi:excisionase family DNA binding protein
MKVLLSVPEAAEETGLDVKSVRAAVARGDIPGLRIGRLIKIPRYWVDQMAKGDGSTGAR